MVSESSCRPIESHAGICRTMLRITAARDRHAWAACAHTRECTRSWGARHMQARGHGHWHRRHGDGGGGGSSSPTPSEPRGSGSRARVMMQHLDRDQGWAPHHGHVGFVVHVRLECPVQHGGQAFRQPGVVRERALGRECFQHPQHLYGAACVVVLSHASAVNTAARSGMGASEYIRVGRNFPWPKSQRNWWMASCCSWRALPAACVRVAVSNYSRHRARAGAAARRGTARGCEDGIQDGVDHRAERAFADKLFVADALHEPGVCCRLDEHGVVGPQHAEQKAADVGIDHVTERVVRGS